MVEIVYFGTFQVKLHKIKKHHAGLLFNKYYVGLGI